MSTYVNNFRPNDITTRTTAQDDLFLSTPHRNVEKGETEVKGNYNPEQNGRGLEVPTGRLRIEVSNIPEFRKLVEQAKQEADQLKRTIEQLRYFELNIDFSSESASSEP